jgi:hypothetical protein
MAIKIIAQDIATRDFVTFNSDIDRRLIGAAVMHRFEQGRAVTTDMASAIANTTLDPQGEADR